MLRVGLVTCADVPRLAADDHLLADELQRRGVATEAVVWDDPAADWAAFDRLVLRSCWDYHLQPGAFLEWLDSRERAGDRIFNPPALVRQNMHKSYLRGLDSGGIPIPPTAWLHRGRSVSLAGLLEQRGWTEAVVKPAVSACAFQTFGVSSASAPLEQDRLDRMLQAGDVLVQRFLPEIQSEGEWSLVFFAGRYSHAVRKRPKGGDFRVQAHLGGTVAAEDPPDSLVQQAEAVADRVPRPWVYARIDGILVDGLFVLLEAELTEPVLFLSCEKKAAGRFADALLG